MRESGKQYAAARPRRSRVTRAALASSAMLLVSLCGFCRPALAEDELFEQNRTTYGDLGLVEMPSARMAADGQLSFSFGALEDAQRIGLGFQMLPWLETSFRYSHVPHFFDDGKQVYDRSFGIKVRLFQETPWTPAVAVGARDIVGTGIYGAEFVVLSKRFWTIDFTAGLGWGRLASNKMFPNPIGYILPSFNQRSTNTGLGGTVDFGQLFHGPDTGLFGGFNWQTPIPKLNLLVEYSSDRYLRESVNTGFHTRVPVNAALSYGIFEDVSIMAGYLYGTTWGGAISFHFDPTQPFFPDRLGPPPPPPAVRTDAERSQSLEALVDTKHQVVTLKAGGSWVNLGTNPNDLREILSAAPSSAARDYEIDGHTLAINVEGPVDMKAQCHIFAQVASTSVPGVTSVAVADLNDHRGEVTLCNVEDYSRLAELAVMDNWPLQKSESDASSAPTLALPIGGSGTAGLTGAALNDKIKQDAAAQRLEVDAVSTGKNTIVVYFENDKYFFETDAVGRLSRVLLADAPPNVEIFRLISLYRGVPMRETQILRSDLERILSYNGSTAELESAVSLAPAPRDNSILNAQQNNYPRFGWSVFPRLARSFFDPKAPARFGIFGDADGYVDIWPGFTLEGLADLAIYNGLAGTATSNSVLPHVRSDFGKYYSQGAYGFTSLTATWRARPAGDVFTEFKAGYLEDMFAGVGGQVLWRPEGQRWAIGADVYQVWQRGFDRLIDLRSYNVVTGHVNIYYESPWYGINVAVHGGRYLAGDWGGTIEISRRFDTGVEVGAFATFTNVPFSQFGEGSFDKGIIIRIPLEWLLPINTQSEAKMDFRPLSRDGGQRLDNDDSLYDETRRTSYGEMYEHFSDIAAP